MSSFTVRLLAALTLLGFAARLALSWVSLGSNDWVTWKWFAAIAAGTGPYAYEHDPTLNHPPIPVVWSSIALLLAGPTRLGFPFLFRLPAILADVGSCVLLNKIWRRRGGDARLGWLAAAAMAWNLDALLVGAYHCNTDNVCAYLTLLAAYLLADRKSPGLAGLALAAAVNVKIVPVLLIPALLAACEDWRGVGRFLLGLAAGVVPFLPLLLTVPAAFARNALFYTPAAGEWGLMFFPMYAQHLPAVAGRAGGAVEWLSRYGKFLMLGACAAVGAAGWIWRGRWSAYELGALAWALFLVLTPGFGFQYTVYVVPLMLAVDLRRGAAYGLAAGLYVLTVYAGTWDGSLPIQSLFTGKPNPMPVPLGLVAWTMLVGFAGSVMLRTERKRPMTKSE
jgi:hypothetical protein